MNNLLSVVSRAALTFCLTIHAVHAMEQDPLAPAEHLVKHQPDLTRGIFEQVMFLGPLERHNFPMVFAHGFGPANDKQYPNKQLRLVSKVMKNAVDRHVEDFGLCSIYSKNGHQKYLLTYLKSLPNLLDLQFHFSESKDTWKHDTIPALPTKLKALGLNCCANIRDKELMKFTNLESLSIKDNSTITIEGLRHLPKLTTLILGDNKNITDKDLEYLPNLKEINLSANDKITAEGLKMLPKLTHVSFRCQDLSYEEKLRNALPEVYINGRAGQ